MNPETSKKTIGEFYVASLMKPDLSNCNKAPEKKSQYLKSIKTIHFLFFFQTCYIPIKDKIYILETAKVPPILKLGIHETKLIIGQQTIIPRVSVAEILGEILPCKNLDVSFNLNERLCNSMTKKLCYSLPPE